MFKLFRKQKPIDSAKTLQAFISYAVGKEAGALVMRYAIKRLGKLHYLLSKQDFNYAQELVCCQVALHAELLADCCHLIARLIDVSNVEDHHQLKQMMEDIHVEFVNSAPEEFKTSAVLAPHHFSRGDMALKNLANTTGQFLFKALPMTDNLHQSNVSIFQGQVRLIYIDFLQTLSKRTTAQHIKNWLSHTHHPQTL